ncbi:peptide-methionine (R)-S-oxide reductase MsrB [Sinimarinibacterium sp. CAU 1509]|uniref:peptide-methionine (R)-S-oxide reductase MsrB n=1 Tax=Sinimarinibacterium sp. CAU 1509 TaxID=2562283 RepID=UPI001B7FA699|nr:peptide-methionine (R)-S-oxide reductase MsrB [Sinimarinibacterium sp. CAU 1509]
MPSMPSPSDTWTRRRLLAAIGGVAAVWLTPHGTAHAAEDSLGSLGLPASHWKPLVSAAAYAVLFNEDTERSGTSPLNHEKRAGTYICAACYQPLFSSEKKFDSGTGWPSFWAPLDDAIGTKRDFKLVFPRTEYHCARCGGHQGHVFDDGPAPTGLRYCNNGVALRFIADGEALPPLRG